MKDVWKVYFNGSFGGKSPDGSCLLYTSPEPTRP